MTKQKYTEHDLPDSCYAYVPKEARGASGAKEKRNLRLCDLDGNLAAARVASAASAMKSLTLSEEDAGPTKSRIRDAWLTINPKATEAEIPEALRTVEAAEVVESPSRAYLTALRDGFNKLVGISITKEDFDKVHRTAMSSAGGKTTAQKKKDKKKEEAVTYREHFAEHPEPVQGCEYCMDSYQVEVLKLPKQDERVSYREAVSAEEEGVTAALPMETCYSCRFYRWGSCNLVEGAIEAEDVCDLWLPPVSTYPKTPSLYVAADPDTGGRRLFMEQQAFADAPEWINILPKPGEYSHPSYGKIAISPDRNKRFIDNFDARVYQQDLPVTIDIEHDGKMSGAVGYFKELRLEEDGSVNAKVEWNDRGKTLIEEDQFRYFSPEWWNEWVEPATQQVFEDVLIGGAITTRPFFKETALRPLVATEKGLALAERDSTAPAVITLRPLAAVQEDRKVSVTLSEEEVQRFREIEARETERESKFAEQESKIQALSEANTKLIADSRRQKFTDTVMGRGGNADGAAWPGPVEENVAHLIALAEAVGEESELFTKHVEHMKATAKTLSESAAFTPTGTAETADTVGVSDEVAKKAREIIAADSSISFDVAVSRVFAEDGKLYEKHRRASRYRETEVS